MVISENTLFGRKIKQNRTKKRLKVACKKNHLHFLKLNKLPSQLKN